MRFIVTALICAILLLPAMAEEPKKQLTDTQKLELARVQLKVTQAQLQAEATLATLKENIQTADAEFKATQAKMLAEIGAPPECSFDGKQTLRCPEKPAAKPEVKK